MKSSSAVRNSDGKLGSLARGFYVDEIEKTITRKVAQTRSRLRYTQEDVAQVLGLHRPAVSEIEAGRRRLTAVELVLLAEFFGVHVTELLP